MWRLNESGWFDIEDEEIFMEDVKFAEDCSMHGQESDNDNVDFGAVHASPPPAFRKSSSDDTHLRSNSATEFLNSSPFSNSASSSWSISSSCLTYSPSPYQHGVSTSFASPQEEVVEGRRRSQPAGELCLTKDVDDEASWYSNRNTVSTSDCFSEDQGGHRRVRLRRPRPIPLRRRSGVLLRGTRGSWVSSTSDPTPRGRGALNCFLCRTPSRRNFRLKPSTCDNLNARARIKRDEESDWRTPRPTLGIKRRLELAWEESCGTVLRHHQGSCYGKSRREGVEKKSQRPMWGSIMHVKKRQPCEFCEGLSVTRFALGRGRREEEEKELAAPLSRFPLTTSTLKVSPSSPPAQSPSSDKGRKRRWEAGEEEGISPLCQLADLFKRKCCVRSGDSHGVAGGKEGGEDEDENDEEDEGVVESMAQRA